MLRIAYVVGAIALAVIAVSFVTAGSTVPYLPLFAEVANQDKEKLADEFTANLRDYNKALDKLRDRVAEGKNKKDDLDEVGRALKGLETEAKNESEKSVFRCAQSGSNWIAARAGMRIDKIPYMERWAAHYDGLMSLVSEVLKKVQKEKTWAGIKCSLCTNGNLSCPACEGAGKCGVSTGGKEKCRNGMHSTDSIGVNWSHVCVVCHGSNVCGFCAGSGQMLCPIEHRVLGK